MDYLYILPRRPGQSVFGCSELTICVRTKLISTKHHKRLGEVVEASTIEFLAQSQRLYNSPPIGTLVKSEIDDAIYGIVAEVVTASIDPGRRAMAMGENEDTAEKVYQRHPQLNRLLSTEFRCIPVGFQKDAHLFRYLSPIPPKIHSSVYECTRDELFQFSRSLEFLPILLTSSVGSQDGVIASFLLNASECNPKPEEFLLHAGKQLAKLLVGQFQRLNGLLWRLSI